MKFKLTQSEKRVLLQSLSVKCLALFGELEKETMDLEIYDYFDKYYKDLAKLVSSMIREYPEMDMSTRDIDLLYKRSHMRDGI